MFTENEIASFVQTDAIKQHVLQLRKEFIQKEAPYMEISEHDFLCLIMLTPVIDLILLDKKISFLEEMKINDKARKMSKGGFFLSYDPVVYACKYLVKKFDQWKEPYYSTLKSIIYTVVNEAEIERLNSITNPHGWHHATLNAPYILIRFIASFFTNHDEEVLKDHKVSEKYRDKILEIGKRLDMDRWPAFQDYLTTLQLKK